MNATSQSHIRGRPANGDFTLTLSHEASCPEEEMGVMVGVHLARVEGVGLCVVMGWDRVRILGQRLSAGLLIWRWTGWSVVRLLTHQMGPLYPHPNPHIPT